jgi:hypothetical protein
MDVRGMQLSEEQLQELMRQQHQAQVAGLAEPGQQQEQEQDQEPHRHHPQEQQQEEALPAAIMVHGSMGAAAGVGGPGAHEGLSAQQQLQQELHHGSMPAAPQADNSLGGLPDVAAAQQQRQQQQQQQQGGLKEEQGMHGSAAELIAAPVQQLEQQQDAGMAAEPWTKAGSPLPEQEGGGDVNGRGSAFRPWSASSKMQ